MENRFLYGCLGSAHTRGKSDWKHWNKNAKKHLHVLHTAIPSLESQGSSYYPMNSWCPMRGLHAPSCPENSTIAYNPTPLLKASVGWRKQTFLNSQRSIREAKTKI